MVIAVVLGIPLGLWRDSDPIPGSAKTIMAGSILGFSLPTFWVGLMLIMLFSCASRLAAADRARHYRRTCWAIESSLLTWDGLRHLFMPALNLALFKLSLARLA